MFCPPFPTDTVSPTAFVDIVVPVTVPVSTNFIKALGVRTAFGHVVVVRVRVFVVLRVEVVVIGARSARIEAGKPTRIRRILAAGIGVSVNAGALAAIPTVKT